MKSQPILLRISRQSLQSKEATFDGDAETETSKYGEGWSWRESEEGKTLSIGTTRWARGGGGNPYWTVLDEASDDAAYQEKAGKMC